MFSLDTSVRIFQGGESLTKTSGYLEAVGNILGEWIGTSWDSRVREREREREKEKERERERE